MPNGPMFAASFKTVYTYVSKTYTWKHTHEIRDFLAFSNLYS